MAGLNNLSLDYDSDSVYAELISCEMHIVRVNAFPEIAAQNREYAVYFKLLFFGLICDRMCLCKIAKLGADDRVHFVKGCLVGRCRSSAYWFDDSLARRETDRARE